MTELTDKERDLLVRVGDNPLELFQGKSVGWLEDFIKLTVGTQKRSQYIVGDLKVISKDLTAETAAYVYSDDSGDWLYCNGAAVSQTIYADLYAFFGAAAYAADSGGNFSLPDARGRALFFTGTNAATQRNDNDGTALATRQAKHIHTAAVTGAPGVGTLAITPNPHDHTYLDPGAATYGLTGGPTNFSFADFVGTRATGGTSLSITGAPTAGTLAVGVGSVGSTDGPSHLFIGSLLVRF